MWQLFVAWFHKWGSPKWFFQQSVSWSFYSGWLSFALISFAFIYGIGFTMAEAVQGHSYRIIYMHVPSASLSMSIYVYMAILSVIGLVWKMKMAFVLSKACA